MHEVVDFCGGGRWLEGPEGSGNEVDALNVQRENLATYVLGWTLK